MRAVDAAGRGTEAASAPRPRLRGRVHQLAFFGALPLGVLVALVPETSRGRAAAVVFAASVAAMFGASALYHRVTWSPEARRWMRRVDHAGIYVLIAGTYTPFGLLVLRDEWQVVVLTIVWSGTAAGILLRFCWPTAPKWLSVVVAVALGWVGVVVFPQLVSRLGLSPSLLVLAGGLCYTAGGVVYALRRPRLAPTAFGYHELFHVLVVVAVALQYAAVAFFVLPRH
jgi:hemolysin III